MYIFFFFFCFSFLQKPARFTGHENPPNKCAKITRRNDPPEKSAMATCQIHMRLKPAEFNRQKDLPFQLAACLPEIPPFPAQNPQAGPGPPTLPPPPDGAGGRGQGAGPAHPRIWNRYFYFHSPFHEWLHILI